MVWRVMSGLFTGFALGWALQRGGFCMNTAFRSVVFREDRSLLRAWILVLLINIPVVTLLETTGVLYPARAPFLPLSLAIGGLIFGAGMVWAGGCVSGTYYRAAKGTLGSFVALLGFAGGALTVTDGILAPLRGLLGGFEWAPGGEVPTLAHLLPLDPWTGRWVVVAVFVGPAAVFLLRSPKIRFAVGWKWPLTGAAVGVLALAAWIFSSFDGRDYGLSLIQPTTAWGRFVLAGDRGSLGWAAWMLLALPGGALAAAIRGKDFRFRLPEPRRVLIQFGGGLVMGVGAALAGGCNIGHGVTGISALSLASVFATIFTMFGNWAATAALWRSARRTAAG